MDGLKAFKYFQSIKLHFTTEKYDVFETRGRINCSRETFNKRRDKLLYEKLANKFPTDAELIQFLVANVAYGHMNVVYSNESDQYYQTWKLRKESITRLFEIDCKTIEEFTEDTGVKDIYDIGDGYPMLLKLYLGGHITLESMVILQDFTDYLSKWEPIIMLWHDHFLTIRKCTKFVKYDKIKLTPIYNALSETLSN